MRAWVLRDPGQLSLVDRPIPMPGRAGVLVQSMRGDLRAGLTHPPQLPLATMERSQSKV
jgi:hypothetical protein